MPLVSVVIPTYNHARYIREAIGSVQAQHIEDLEIVVIDDGSTDETPEILAGIHDPRLLVVRTSNQGISAARNEGLARATGDFIAFLDSDDRWRPGKLARQLSILSSDASLVAVFTNFVRFTDQGELLREQFAFYPELASLPLTLIPGLDAERIAADAFSALVRWQEIPSWVQTVMLRSSAVNDLRFPERLAICEDLHYCLLAYRRGAVALIRDPLVEVRRHGTNTTSRLDELPQALLSALLLLGKETLTQEQRRALDARVGRAWISAGLAHVSRQRRGSAAKAFLRALGYRSAYLSAIKQLALLPFGS